MLFLMIFSLLMLIFSYFLGGTVFLTICKIKYLVLLSINFHSQFNDYNPFQNYLLNKHPDVNSMLINLKIKTDILLVVCIDKCVKPFFHSAE